jgi:NADP-dependent 3-hydroxy acid dehydrogenase YdfG
VHSDPARWKTVVTGGSSGLGAAVAAALLERGADVISLDRKPSEHVATIDTDLADGRAAERATVEAAERLGGLDAVVTCAGIDTPSPFGTLDGAAWDRIVAVNLLGTAAVIRAGLPYLEESAGRVVTVASTLGHRAVGDATAYCASKFGVVGLSRALTAEFRGRVGVTLLTPGGMHTAFFDDRDEQYKPPPDARLASPGDIAAAVVWALQQPDGVEVKELAIMAPGEGSWP